MGKDMKLTRLILDTHNKISSTGTKITVTYLSRTDTYVNYS